MHDIFLLRHAAARSSSPDGSDFSRPLRPRGEKQALQVGLWLHEHGVALQRVLCSPAVRAASTARIVLETIGSSLSPVFEPAIYQAVPGTLIQLLEKHADVHALLLVGHNPGIEQLVGMLRRSHSGGAPAMPTAGLAWLRTTMPLQPGEAHLHAFWSP